jgi:REP element-mobilizing transposase RayT
MPYDSLEPPRRLHRSSKQPPTFAYFITLTVKDRACVLAEILEDDIRLTLYGQLVRQAWFNTSLALPNITLDDSEFVVMPNHIHGLVRLQPEPPAPSTEPAWMQSPAPFNHRVPNTLPGFVRTFKAGVTQSLTAASLLSEAAFWERSYEEQLVHGETMIKRIRQRIQINPYRWETDPLHPDFPAHPA